MNTKKRVLFLGKKNDKLTEIAASICAEKFKFTKTFFVQRTDEIDKNIKNWRGDIIISYLYPKLISKKLLSNAKLISINFHPGPPEYPGIGCTNYAIYNKEKQYGVTCHIMNEVIDAGDILEVKRFKLRKNETLISLTERAYLHLFEMYLGIVEKLKNNQLIEVCKNEKWIGKAKTKKNFENFLLLNSNMKPHEIKRRIIATTWPKKDSAYFKIKGFKFFGKLDNND